MVPCGNSTSGAASGTGVLLMTKLASGVTVGGYAPRGETGVSVGMLVGVAVGRGVSVGRRVFVGRRVGVQVNVAVGGGVLVWVGVDTSGVAVLPLCAAMAGRLEDTSCHKNLRIETSSIMATSASPMFNRSVIRERDLAGGVL